MLVPFRARRILLTIRPFFLQAGNSTVTDFLYDGQNGRVRPRFASRSGTRLFGNQVIGIYLWVALRSPFALLIKPSALRWTHVLNL